MKKMLILALIALFYIAVSAMVSPQTVPVDKDVGYSLTIDQNVLQIDIIASDAENYQISRGVSVPDKGLSNEAIYINLKNQNSQISRMCNIDNYSLTWQESISTNLELIHKGVNLFACDLGTWERYPKINIV